MKKIFFLTCLLLSAVMTFAQTKKVAILEVVDREGRMEYSQKMMLRANMARAVANTNGYEAYDRSDVDAIMSEHEFQRTGLVNEDQIRQLGEMTGVSLILVTEGVLTGTNSVFVSAKILNVETAKVEIMDNMTMGLSAADMQQGCMQLAKRLFGVTATSSAIEKYNIERMGTNEYIYLGKYMDKREYELFLRNNCPQAYSQYRKGQRMIISGWSLLGAGALIMVAGGVMMGCHKPNPDSKVVAIDGLLSGGIAACAIGGAVMATSIPLVCIGYSKRNNAYKTYNNTCASSSASPITFNLTAGSNGLGIVMQF